MTKEVFGMRKSIGKAQGMALLIFVNVMWGLSFIISKTALSEGMPSMTLAFWRYVMTAVIMVPLCIRLEGGIRLREWAPRAFATTMLGITVYYFFEYNGLRRTTASAASLILALVPLRVEIRRRIEGPPLRIRLSAGPLHITKRLGGKSEKKAAKPGKKAEKKKTAPKAEQKEKKPGLPVDLTRLDIPDTLSLVFDLMDDLAGSLTFERLFVTVIVHTEDAAKTANLLGGMCAVTGILYPELARRFVLRDHQITLDADFEAEKTVWRVDISVMTRAGRYPQILWRRRKQLWKLWKTIRRQDAGEQITEKEQ